MSNSLPRSAFSGTPLPEAWLTLGAGAMVSGALVLWFPGDVGMKILAMLLFWLVSITSIRMDVTHPFFWFGGPFLLYSISGPLLFILDIHPNKVWGGFLLSELDYDFAMDLQYMGLLASSLVIGPERIDLRAALRDPNTTHFFNGVLPVLALTIILSGFTMSEIILQGFTQKIDVVLYGSWATRFGFALNMVSTCVGVFLIKQFVERKPLRAFVAIACFIVLGVTVVLLVGQRNFMFRVLIVVLFSIHISYHKISLRNFLILFLATTPLILILGGFKMAGIAGNSAASYFSIFENIVNIANFAENLGLMGESPIILYGKFLLFLILGDEFRTAGDNLAMLVTRMPVDVPFQNGVTLINDLITAVSPGFLKLHANSSTYFYNEMVFPVNTSKGGGQGFSLVGAGYLNFGVAGAILIMLVFGAAVRFVYRRAAKSALGLFFFIGFLPISFAASRNDLTMPISQGLKHVLLPLAAMILISYLMGRSARPALPGGARR